ncbi:MAG: hypothetical protein R3290_09685, partial [Acidimicrobiia bacterium]|nr:hypothetical protein [Acidimicrobiia bacterium]
MDVDWGDGTSATDASQPFCHSYPSASTYTITASRFDIDSGAIPLGTIEVSTLPPNVSGPWEPGTMTFVDPVVGQTVEFRFSIPGPYGTLSVGTDGDWTSGSGTSFQ